MKCVFLDVDGVLNNTSNGCHLMGDRENVRNFNTIIDATGANIVISSSWRQYMLPDENGLAAMSLYGFGVLLNSHGVRGGIAGHIGDFDKPRGCKIRDWMSLNGHRQIERYVVLDDCDDEISAMQLPFVRTNPNEGLTAADAAKAIEILNRGPMPLRPRTECLPG